MMSSIKSYRSAVSALALALASVMYADVHTAGTPMLSSRPGAAYTVYVDFAGFTFNGTWGDTGQTPGFTPAYGGAVGNFSAVQQNELKGLWAGIANKYMPFNVNVTTVDPAVAAGQADTDAHREAFYDNTRYLEHSVIGGTGDWFGLAGGVSYVGVSQMIGSEIGVGDGWKTNWIFSDTLQIYHPTDYVKADAVAAAHENGHAIGLWHQSDHNIPNVADSEYSTNNHATGDGSYAPTMGVTYYSQRSAWRVGFSLDINDYQNDVQLMANDPNMGGLIEDGIGHTFAGATTLSLSGEALVAGANEGVIVSADAATPQPLGVDNYSKDFFSFHTNGGIVSLTANDGTDFLQAGVADAGAMLNSDLKIFDHNGTLVGIALQDSSTMFETYTGNLGAGDYYAVVMSHGGYQSTFDVNAQYYDMGAYFLTGNIGGAAVPEPCTMAGLTLAGLAMLKRRKKA